MKREGFRFTGIFLLAAVIFVCSAGESYSVSTQQADAIKDAELGAGTQSVSNNIPRPSFPGYQAATFKDPFQEPVISSGLPVSITPEPTVPEVPEQPLPHLEVQGVIWGGNLPQAIINNKIVKEGDTIEGAKVIDINKTGVVVSFGKKEYDLPMPGISASTGTGN